MGRKLHCTVVFRSHDVGQAYAQNLAAVCLWLCRLAEKHGMEVGTVTCVSVSAHLYDRDWDAARAVVAAYEPPAIRWDQRASWRVERVPLPEGYAEEIECPACGKPKGVRCTPYHTCGKRCIDALSCLKPPALRATALSPDGSEVLATFEARTPEALARQCVDSGLITEIGAAVWLGREIARVARQH